MSIKVDFFVLIEGLNYESFAKFVLLSEQKEMIPILSRASTHRI